MHISRTNSSSTEAILTVKATAEELAQAKQHALGHFKNSVKVPGFRQGNVPPAILEKHIDPNALQSEVLEETISRLYALAVREEDLRPVANPEISIKKFVPYTDLEFEAKIATVGAIKIADYKNIKLAPKTVKVDAKDVDNVLQSLRTRAAKAEEVDREAIDGDQVIIDFKGKDSKGQPVAGADGVDYPLILGSNSFIPGFESNLIGVKPGETKEFTIIFPKDYGVSALQNKKVTFTVTVKRVNKMELPKLDDEFAASVGPFKTLIELKDDIKKQVEIERTREADVQFENELLEKIAAKSEMEIPAMLIDEQIDRIEAEEKQNLIYRGVTFEEHLKEEGVTPEQHRDQKRPAAEQRVKVGILLAEISEKEQIHVTPEEVEVRLRMMRAQYRDQQAQAELDKPEARRDIQSRIMSEKTLEKLKAYARTV